MSAELEIIDGQAQTMLKEDAWHRLGTVVGDNFGWPELVAANLSITWPVEKVALSNLVMPGVTVDEHAFVAYRTTDDRVLYAGHGDNWTSFLPEIGYDFVTFLREEGLLDANLVSASTIRGGRQWFFTFERGDYKIGDYTITSHITVSGSFDGSWAFQVLSSETVAVCANTIAAVHHAGQQVYKFKNTSGIFDRVDAAKAVASQQRAREMGFKQLGERLLGVKVGEATYRSMVDLLFPVGEDVSTKTNTTNGRARDSVRALYVADGTDLDVVQGVEGTGWGFVQAVNTYENWGAPIRKTKGLGEASTRALRQIDTIVSGKQPLTDKALDLVLAP